MRTDREINHEKEFEDMKVEMLSTKIALARSRQQIVQISMIKMQGDYSALELEIDNLNAELAEIKKSPPEG